MYINYQASLALL